MPNKHPISVLIVIHTLDLDVLLLERTGSAGFWQSVTGSLEGAEGPRKAAVREVMEETNISADASQLIDWRLKNRFEIFPMWRHRYAEGVTHNVEHVFSLPLAKRETVSTAPSEHTRAVWLPWQEAAALCFSWTNRDAILMLPLQLGTVT